MIHTFLHLPHLRRQTTEETSPASVNLTTHTCLEFKKSTRDYKNTGDGFILVSMISLSVPNNRGVVGAGNHMSFVATVVAFMFCFMFRAAATTATRIVDPSNGRVWEVQKKTIARTTSGTFSMFAALSKRQRGLGKRYGRFLPQDSKSLSLSAFVSSTVGKSCFRRAGGFSGQNSHWKTSCLPFLPFYVRQSCRHISNTSNERDIPIDNNILSSTQSNTVKRIKNLLQKRKVRMEQGQTVVEGPRIILDLLRNSQTRHLIDTIVVAASLDEYAKDANDKRKGTKTTQKEQQRPEYLAEIESYNQATHDHFESFRIFYATRQVLQACSGTVTPQGIVAIANIPQFDSSNIDKYRKGTADNEAMSAIIPKSPLYLVLDNVSDPGNMGTLLRTAVATGVAAVLLLPGCCDVWNPKAIRSAMTASFLIPTVTVVSWDAAVKQLQDRGVCHIWAATMLEGEEEAHRNPNIQFKGNNNDENGSVLEAETRIETPKQHKYSPSIPHYEIDWCQGPTALVIGNEGSGLSPDIRQQLNKSNSMIQYEESNANIDDQAKSNIAALKAVHIPMCPGIESLNAAICGSVILFEYLRQHGRDQRQN